MIVINTLCDKYVSIISGGRAMCIIIVLGECKMKERECGAEWKQNNVTHRNFSVSCYKNIY